LFEALQKSGIDVDGVGEDVHSIYESDSSEDDENSVSPDQAAEADPIAEYLAKWANDGKSAKQRAARTTAVAVLRQALINFAAYGKALDSQKFFQDIAHAKLGIRPKIRELLKKYKVDGEFEVCATCFIDSFS
jgi:hypothetical protein